MKLIGRTSALILLICFSGCGQKNKIPKEYPREKVEVMIKSYRSALAREGIPLAAKFKCPKPLAGKPGSEVTCQARAPGYRQKVRVSIVDYRQGKPLLFIHKEHTIIRLPAE